VSAPESASNKASHDDTSVYRASTIKRQRRTRNELDQLDAQIIAVLRADHPQSVRHVFYQMTNPRLAVSVEKSDRGYRHVQERCVRLRRTGALRKHLDSAIDLDFARIAINEEQIAQYDLPTKPRKVADRRSPEVAATVEAEAMPASILRGLLRGAIEALLPENALAVAKVAEESEREHIGRMAALFNGANE